jgi:hypothetical protein
LVRPATTGLDVRAGLAGGTKEKVLKKKLALDEKVQPWINGLK